MDTTPTIEAASLAQQLVQVVAALPDERVREVIDFALFLQARIAANDAKWEASFAATDSATLRAWLEAEKADDEDLRPMFDDVGNFAV